MKHPLKKGCRADSVGFHGVQPNLRTAILYFNTHRNYWNYLSATIVFCSLMENLSATSITMSPSLFGLR